MRSLAEVLAGTGAPKRQTGNRYRRNSQFVLEELTIGRPLDRNDKAKLLHIAEAMERRTKEPGRKNGVLGYIGLSILRCLLLRFLGANGACSPSYLALQCASGLCRASVAEGLRRLERAGLLKVIRRLKREVIERVSPITGNIERIVTTVQDTNAYCFAAAGNVSTIVERLHTTELAPNRVHGAGRNLPSVKIKGLLRSLAQGLAMGSANYPQLCE
jgi:hypothetical protein